MYIPENIEKQIRERINSYAPDDKYIELSGETLASYLEFGGVNHYRITGVGLNDNNEIELCLNDEITVKPSNSISFSPDELLADIYSWLT